MLRAQTHFQRLPGLSKLLGAFGKYPDGNFNPLCCLGINDEPCTPPFKDNAVDWMVEAFLRARVSGSAAIKDLLNGPSIFPFRLPISQPNIWHRSRLV